MIIRNTIHDNPNIYRTIRTTSHGEKEKVINSSTDDAQGSQPTTGGADNLQTPGTGTTGTISSSRVSQPVTRRMPRNSRNTSISTGSRNSVDTISRLSMEDLKTISTASKLITSAADIAAIETPAHTADGTAILA